MAELLPDPYKLDRGAVSVVRLHDPPDDVDFWRMQTPEARIRHMEWLRWLNYGISPADGRLQRVLEIARRDRVYVSRSLVRSRSPHAEDNIGA